MTTPISSGKATPNLFAGPSTERMQKHERKGERAIYAAMGEVFEAHIDGLTDDTVHLLTSRVGDVSTWQPVRDAILAWLLSVAEDGSDYGRQQVESAIGVKSIFDIGFDWELVNEKVAQWALDYADNLVGNLSKTTTPRIQRLVADFTRNSWRLSDLVEKIQDSWLYSRSRAQSIAVTETTRAFAEGNTTAWRESGIVDRRRWNTARDELVCPVCGPLHRVTTGINDPFPDGMPNPPAHPRCRCWVTPVIDV